MQSSELKLKFIKEKFLSVKLAELSKNSKINGKKFFIRLYRYMSRSDIYLQHVEIYIPIMVHQHKG